MCLTHFCIQRGEEKLHLPVYWAPKLWMGGVSGDIFLEGTA